MATRNPGEMAFGKYSGIPWKTSEESLESKMCETNNQCFLALHTTEKTPDPTR